MSVLGWSLAVLVDVLALLTLAAGVRSGCARRYGYLSLYLVGLFACDALRYAFLLRYGFSSLQYFYAFYLSDAFLAILAYRLILGFFDSLFRGTPLRRQVRLALMLFFLLIAGMSYVFISHSVQYFYSRLVVEFQQNLYFAEVVLTALLWVSLVHLRIGDRQLRLLITGMGVHAAALAGGYALQNLLPREVLLLTRKLSPLATAGMLGLWWYTLARVPAAAPAEAPAAEPRLAEAEAQ